MLNTDARAQSAGRTPAAIPAVPSDNDPGVLNGARGDDSSHRLAWTPAPQWPLDWNGPVDRPFTRMGDAFSTAPACEHLKRTAEKFPDKLAISDGTVQLTYAELFLAVRNLARLIAAAVPAGQAVGLFLGSSAWYPVAMLASMAAGRPSVQLNPRDPLQRIVRIVEDARLPALVSAGRIDFAAWPSVPNLASIDATTVLSAHPIETQETPLDPISVDAPAIILYTSGSTGRPKGIVNSQRSILQRVQQYVDACHFNSDDVFLPLSGSGTIAGCRETLTALLCGATLHLVDVEAVGLRRVQKQMREFGVTAVYLVPALLRALMTSADKDDFSTLRIVRIGGEKVIWTDINLARTRISDSCFIQVSYLSTETTGSQWFLPNDYPERGATVPAGYILPGIGFVIIDDDGLPARAGEAGELWIRSMYVTLGQWEEGRVLRAEPDPDDPRYRIFATGDLARVDERGLLQIVGRKGRQIKINGRRVEPAELELVLRRASRVGDAVAIATDANELIAFAAPVGEEDAAFIPELREIVRRALPTSLHPSRLHSVGEIPRLPGGKVDAIKLRELDCAFREKEPDLEPARSAGLASVESAVEHVWRSILNTRAAIGRWDEAGGDSLKLLQCVMELETLVGRELNLEAFTVDMSAADMIVAIGPERDCAQQTDKQADAPRLMFLLPGSVGYGPSLAAFGAEMNNVARVASIRYPDLGAILQGQGSVSAMADAALKLINLTQPDGDIRLLGYSLGGGVAFEVAARLIAAGRSVRFFGILDTSIDGTSGLYSETLARTLQRIRSHRVTLYRMCCRAVAKCVARFRWEARFARLLDRHWTSHLAGTRFMLKLELEEVLRVRAFRRWLTEPKFALPITGTLFRCDRREASQDLGWGKLFANLDIVPIAGGHLDLVVAPHLALNRPLIEEALIATYP